MTYPHVLRVLLDGEPVGDIEQERTGQLAFRYLEDYRTRPDATPLSLSMPLREPQHRHRAVHPFLAGLLPDSSGILRRWSQEYSVSARNPFALLAHRGLDLPGAIELIDPAEQPPDRARATAAIPDLTDLIATLRSNALTWDPGIPTGRWSLAGAQAKVALCFRDGKWWRSIPDHPTTHILKPANPALPGHEVNEHLCLSAAAHLGIASAQSQVLSLDDGTGVLAVRRFDRVEVNGNWHRLHHEDYCQALSVHPQLKYESDGGPGTHAIGRLIASLPRIREREAVARALFEQMIFNVAIGNPDAHAKNYSLILRGPSVRHAPLYDAASGLPYPDIVGRRPIGAMRLGAHWDLTLINTEDLRTVASRLRLDADWAVNRARSITADLPHALAAAAAASSSVPDPSDMLRRLPDIVTAHLARLPFAR